MVDPYDILSVSELTKQIKQTLEEVFPFIAVQGEISNYKAHISGHWYFNLKDADSVISCTMWKGMNNNVFFTPQDGMKVTVSGRITVYPPRGNYQFDVRSMKPAGAGELNTAFEILKKKLSSEGLFDAKFKKPIPSFAKRIGVITAINGAALRDMISILKRRFPLVELVIAPAKVQGSGAAESIVDALNILNKKNDIDIIIVARGGGSIEDLWAFNEEIVARAIFSSQIPVISGVGHEVDTTISDYVADIRASTPSVAMEIATKDKEEIFAFINEFSYNSARYIDEFVSLNRSIIQNYLDSYGFRMPLDLLRRKSQQIDGTIYKLTGNFDKLMLKLKNKVLFLTKSLDAHDITKMLKKGFVLVRQDSKFITRAGNFLANRETILKFYDDEIKINSKNSN